MRSRKRIPHEARTRFITTLVSSATIGNLPPEPQIEEGFNVYIDYIESQILKCSSISNDELARFFGDINGAEDRAKHLFDAAIIIANFLKTLNSQSTLDDIAQELIAKTTHYRAAIATENQSITQSRRDGNIRIEHHIVFTCLGWLCMLFIPLPHLSGHVFRISDTAPTLMSISSNLNAATPLIQPPGIIQRPLGSMLRGMGLLPIPCPIVPSVATNHLSIQSGTSLPVSVLCYFSLRYIGGLSVVWVDTMLDHCRFDSVRKELKLFRFPTYCFHTYNRQPDIKILSSILKAHTCQQSCENNLPKAVETYLGEILLSYRLLFGQDKRSRKLFRSEESVRARFDGGTLDPVLYLLCGQKRLSSTIDLIKEEREVFDSRIDFPYLGSRLQELHDYNAKQKPSTWRSIFADRRDPRESFNFFWTIILVGGISITLSFVQTGVAIAQLIKTFV